MKALPLLLAVLAVPCLARAQAAPTAVAPLAYSGLDLSFVSGTFQYGVNLSEIFQTGYLSNGDVSRQTSISGDLAYSTKSVKTPFALVYTGGAQFTNQSNVSNTFFQSLALSQGYNTRDWNLGISDLVSYLPQSPTVGLSGIPGTGDLGLYPLGGVNAPSQSVLTYNADRVSNTVAGSVSRRLSGRTSLSGDASYGLLHFFDNGTLDTRQINADVAVNRVIDARTSASLAANYSIFTYSAGANTSFQTRGLNVRVERQLSRALSASVGAGPLWISSSSSLAIPSRLSYSAAVSLNYTRRALNLGLAFSRGANGGSGVQPGAISDNLSAIAYRSFGRDWSASANVGYFHTSGLSDGPAPVNLGIIGYNTLGNIDGIFGGAQVSRRLGERFSAYAGYNGTSQSYSNSANATSVAPYALNGLIQTFSLGVSFFPRSVNLGRF